MDWKKLQLPWNGNDETDVEQKRETAGDKKKPITLKSIGLKRLVLLFGSGVLLLLLCMPDSFLGDVTGAEKKKEKQQEETTAGAENSSGEDYISRMENRLKTILSKVEGAGEVEVMITLSESGEKVALKDAPYSSDSVEETDSAGGTRKSESYSGQESTILVDGEEGGETPYIIKEMEPRIEGVVVLAAHGDDASLQKEIIDAVQVLFDVPVHKIKVMKRN